MTDKHGHWAASNIVELGLPFAVHEYKADIYHMLFYVNIQKLQFLGTWKSFSCLSFGFILDPASDYAATGVLDTAGVQCRYWRP